jgi:hypothetical protein
MKCLICGRLSLPGAKLCLDCKAARKRAFDATVTQPLLAAAGAGGRSTVAPRLLRPRQSVPDAARRAAKMALAAQAQAKVESATPPRRASRWPIVVGAMCVAVVAIGYMRYRFAAGRSDTLAAVPVESPHAQEAPTTSSIVRASTVAPTGVPTNAPVALSAPRAEPATIATKADAAKAPSVRSRPEKAPIALPPPEALPPPVVSIVRPPPPPVVREVPRPDKWQLMSEAIARCPRSDISGRVSCEQQLRVQYCEGLWGQVAQCSSIPYNDHGQ